MPSGGGASGGGGSGGGAGKGQRDALRGAALVRMGRRRGGTGGITSERERVKVRVECVDPMKVDDCTNLEH